MITLKRHYAASVTVQAISLVILATGKAKSRKTGKYIFTPHGQKRIRSIGLGILGVGTAIHYTAHSRLIGRGAKALHRVVKK